MNFIHEAIYKLNPNVITINGEVAYNKDGNQIEIDMDAVEIKASELQSEYEAEQQAKIDTKQSAIDKLKRLGLTEEEALALISK